MPRGLIRYQQTGEFHFLTFSCYRRLPYLGTAAARDLLERALERMRRRYVLRGRELPEGFRTRRPEG
jgi:putative transposase